MIAPDEWIRRKPKWLLAFLLSKPGVTFSYDMLIDSLIGHCDPEKGRRNLYALVNKLRRTLQPDLERPAHSTFILRNGEGYCFDSNAPYSLDTEQFETLIKQGDALENVDQWDTARDCFQQAIDLYAGDFLPENRYDEWTLPLREHWTTRYVKALKGLARCLAAMGDFASAVALCHRVARYVPYDESSYHMRMYYHYSAGEFDKAEETFRSCIRMLKESLDTKPSSELLKLHDQIRSRSAPRMARWVPNNLPQSLSSFIGRATEIGLVSQLVRENRMVTLAGVGGIGKTRLALEIGSSLLGEFTDGVWFADLGSIADAGHVAEQVAATVSVRVGADQTYEDALMTHFGSKKTLLILDTCEHLVDGCASLARCLLKTCPDLHILATSREALSLPGEMSWHVPLLRVPEASMSAEEMQTCEAVQLLLERIRRGLPQFTLSAETSEQVILLCRGLDGLPLAIELAASRAKRVPLDELVLQTAEMATEEIWEVRAGAIRHRSLRAAIRWSYDLLSEHDQAVFRCAAIFSGGFTLDSATKIASNEVATSGAIRESVSRLVEKSLLVYDATPGSERYRLLDTIRAFALQQLAAAHEVDGCKHRHMNHYASLAARAKKELRGPAQKHWFRILENELHNFRAALSWSLESGEVPAGLRLVVALSQLWARRYCQEEGLKWIERLLLVSSKVPKRLFAHVLKASAELLLSERPDRRDNADVNLELAIKNLSEACALHEQLDDRTEWARSRLLIGNARFMAGERQEAKKVFEEVLAVDREVGNRSGQAACLANLARIYLKEDDEDAALPLLEKALSIAREIGSIDKAQHFLRDIGGIYERKQGYAQAWKSWNEGLALAHQTGDQEQEMVMLVLMAIASGTVEELHMERFGAMQYWNRALSLALEMPSSHAETHVLTNYAEFWLRNANYEKARSIITRALPLALDRGENLYAACCGLLLALIVCHDGNPEVAMQLDGAVRAAEFDITSERHLRELDAEVTKAASVALEQECLEAAQVRGAQIGLRNAVASALGQLR